MEIDAFANLMREAEAGSPVRPRPAAARGRGSARVAPAEPALESAPAASPVDTSGCLRDADTPALASHFAAFNGFGKATVTVATAWKDASGGDHSVPAFVNEYWTSAQRAAANLHEISYRACFKPQLPRFFIERFTRPGDVVYDPFMGRGTTLLEAALLGRVPAGCDINPLSVRLVRPRLDPPTLAEVAGRLGELDLRPAPGLEIREDLLAFYHPETLGALTVLRNYLIRRKRDGTADRVDDWIGMVSLNRLTGHSAGFFSVYTLPPNQATSVERQLEINRKRGQTPPLRDIKAILLKKSRQLLETCTPEVRRVLASVGPGARLVTAPASNTPSIPSGSVQLVVTSPPFLNVVQYAADQWLRCWFIGVDPKSVEITMTSRVSKWREVMTQTLAELKRVLAPGGRIAFEVGEVRGGRIRLEEEVLPCGQSVGLVPEMVLINDQLFTKTANCWGVDNNGKGTNTNRIVIFRRHRDP